LATAGFQPGFGQFPPGFSGIDAYIDLTSEGDPLHGAPGLVDVITTKGGSPSPIATVPVAYANQAGTTPSMLSLSIPLADFSSNQINLLDTGNFSVVVGNVNNATDFLGPPAAVPEPGSVILLSVGLSLGGLASARLQGWSRRP
jgi:hypothetical protein